MNVLMIYGPPGTGKTAELIEYAQREISQGKRGVFLSYTKTAAAEAVSRINGDGMRIGTLHSLAFQALRLSRPSVVDKAKLQEFSNATGFAFGGRDADGYMTEEEGDQYLTVVSYSRNARISPNESYDRLGRPGTTDRFKIFNVSYYEWKRAHGYMDFDDMLQACIDKDVKWNYETVLLDEAQDCSPLQWQVFQRVCHQSKQVFVAGDDDQAIYEWNGADPHGMMKFMERNKGQMHILAKSYRVPRRVYDLAHDKILPLIGHRVDKVFDPRNAPGEVTRWAEVEMLEPQSLHDSNAFILTRDRYRQDEIKKWLNANMTPYDVIGGFSPWTGRLARQLKAGETTMADVPAHWREFYEQADLSAPPQIRLATIHQAKGREAEHVVLDLHMPQRVMQEMDMNPDAELRVLYVGITRARSSLTLCGEHPWIS
jgi:superfamily I DNA/RNA helicase